MDTTFINSCWYYRQPLHLPCIVTLLCTSQTSGRLFKCKTYTRVSATKAAFTWVNKTSFCCSNSRSVRSNSGRICANKVCFICSCKRSLTQDVGFVIYVINVSSIICQPCNAAREWFGRCYTYKLVYSINDQSLPETLGSHNDIRLNSRFAQIFGTVSHQRVLFVLLTGGNWRVITIVLHAVNSSPA